MHLVGVHPQADGDFWGSLGIAADMFHKASVDPCMGVAPPHVAGRLGCCPSALGAVSALVVPPPSLSSFPIFSVVVRVIVQVRVVEAADRAVLSLIEFIDAGMENPENSSHHRQNSTG